jgi:hypothetical protein
MTNKTGVKLAIVGNAFMFLWLIAGVTAAFLVQGQLGWFLVSLGLSLSVACGCVCEVILLRRTAELRVKTAEVEVEAWPYVIRTLEDLERIAPERAEAFEVARLEMAAHLEVSRTVASGRLPSMREMLRLRRAMKDES